MNQIALFTVIYPGSEIYFKDFNECLMSQTCMNFDLIVVNDGCGIKVSDIFNVENIIELNGIHSIAKNREIGINYAIESGYKYLVLCDIDDIFTPNRTERVVELFNDHNVDIIVNDVNIIGPDKTCICPIYFSHSVTSETKINLEFMLKKNMMGFSNTAIKLKKLHKIVIPEELCVVDWYLFTLLIYKGFNVKVILEPLTGYRQYANNMIGIDTLTIEQFKKKLELREFHFRLLTSVSSIFVPYWQKSCKDLSATNMQIEYSNIKNKEINPYPLWWENINIK